MFPLWDENPTKRTPVVTILLIVACIGVFFGVQPQSDAVGDVAFTYERAAIPCEIVNGRPLTDAETRATVENSDFTACAGDEASGPTTFPDKNVWLSVLTSLFLHGSILHLGGNMLFLWVFGNNVEDHLGRIKYILFYLLAGIAATIAHLASALESTIPLIGASGAVAGVMGAYLVWFPTARVRTIVVIVLLRLPAFVPLGVWFVSQFFIDSGDGIAWRAHVGGFVVGVAVGLMVRAARSTERTAWDPKYVVEPTPGGWNNRYGGRGDRPW